MIGAITALLVFQLLGELLARLLHLPVPGPVVGMVALFAWLLLRHGGDGREPPERTSERTSEGASGGLFELGRVADALLGNLGLLFIPAGVGVVTYGPLLARQWAPIALAVLAGTLFAVAATGWLAQALLRRLG